MKIVLNHSKIHIRKSINYEWLIFLRNIECNSNKDISWTFYHISSKTYGLYQQFKYGIRLV